MLTNENTKHKSRDSVNANFQTQSQNTEWHLNATVFPKFETAVKVEMITATLPISY